MKHKYVLYTIAVLLVLNTGLYCLYAVKQFMLTQKVNDFVETTRSRLDGIEANMQKTVLKDRYDGDSKDILDRLNLLESAFKQETVELQSKLDGLAESSRLNVLTERISNLEQAYIRSQALPNQLEIKSRSAQPDVLQATP